MCKVCSERVATVFITHLAGGRQQEEALCEECAQEYTQGETWLKSMALKFGLPETASDVMQGIAEKLPPMDEAPEIPNDKAANTPASDFAFDASLYFSGELSLPEFPSDEDAADALADIWDEAELQQLLPYLDKADDEKSDTDELESPFGEISYEAMKASWLGEQSSSTPPSKPTELNSNELPREIVAERCAKCGTTWDRLCEDGRAGCAQCYDAFHGKLVEVMNRMQREAQHVGKTPHAAQKRRRRLEHLRAQRDHRLEMLNRRLQEAVVAENYEDAAQLRDKIKVVSSTNAKVAE